MLSFLKPAMAKNKVAPGKVPATYKRYRVQALLSADESPNDFGKNH